MKKSGEDFRLIASQVAGFFQLFLLLPVERTRSTFSDRTGLDILCLTANPCDRESRNILVNSHFMNMVIFTVMLLKHPLLPLLRCVNSLFINYPVQKV